MNGKEGETPVHIVVVGLNYKTAPIQVREKFTFSSDHLPQALHTLRQTRSMMETVILGTCNRMEIYVVVDRKTLCGHYILGFLEKWFGIERDAFTKHLYIYEDRQAVEHLFRVTCGLDSMVVGETQILGQVRDAFLLAQQKKTTGTLFNMLFKQAITVAKRAHAETSIGENPVSVSYAAVELGKRIFGHFEGKSVLILGAGKMSERTAVHLNASGTKDIVVVNRTLERAQELALKFGGRAVPYEQLTEALAQADITISSTGADQYVLTKEQVTGIMRQRKSRPLFMIDIAVPRDIDPAIGELEQVFLYDIDDLQNIVDTNLAQRLKEAMKIEASIQAEGVLFEQWLNTLGVAPVIHALQQKATQIHDETLTSLLNKLPELDERQVKLIRKLTKSMLNQMLRDPIVRVKELAGDRKGEEAIALMTQLFALEGILAEENHSEIPVPSSTVQEMASDPRATVQRSSKILAST